MNYTTKDILLRFCYVYEKYVSHIGPTGNQNRDLNQRPHVVEGTLALNYGRNTGCSFILYLFILCVYGFDILLKVQTGVLLVLHYILTSHGRFAIMKVCTCSGFKPCNWTIKFMVNSSIEPKLRRAACWSYVPNNTGSKLISIFVNTFYGIDTLLKALLFYVRIISRDRTPASASYCLYGIWSYVCCFSKYYGNLLQVQDSFLV